MYNSYCVVCGAEIPEGYGVIRHRCAELGEEGRDGMTANEYQQLAMRTANKNLSPIEELENGLMGLNGEAGEAIDLLKKHLFQGHPLDRTHMAKELGDIAWYLAASAYAINYPLEEIFKMNIEKLRERYPEGFEAARSVNRKPQDV